MFIFIYKISVILNVCFIIYFFIFIPNFMKWFHKQNKKKLDLLEEIKNNLEKYNSTNDFS